MNACLPDATSEKDLDDGFIEALERFPGARELTLAKAREIPLADMNQAELQVVILHDPDISERRAALRLFKLEILLDAETRILRALTEAKK